MENLKLISVRIDPKTLEKIDTIQKVHHYWKRNAIINSLLTAVVDAMDAGAIYDMVRYTRNSHTKPRGSFYLPD
jgi:metal-responsive CopG/Arc/MetJ family transcriptional regulator